MGYDDNSGNDKVKNKKRDGIESQGDNEKGLQGEGKNNNMHRNPASEQKETENQEQEQDEELPRKLLF